MAFGWWLLAFALFVATKTVAKLSQNTAKSLRFQAKSTPSLRFALLLVILLAHFVVALPHFYIFSGEVLPLAKFCKIYFLCMSYYRLIAGLFLVLCARLWFGG